MELSIPKENDIPIYVLHNSFATFVLATHDFHDVIHINGMTLRINGCRLRFHLSQVKLLVDIRGLDCLQSALIINESEIVLPGACLEINLKDNTHILALVESNHLLGLVCSTRKFVRKHGLASNCLSRASLLNLTLEFKIVSEDPNLFFGLSEDDASKATFVVCLRLDHDTSLTSILSVNDADVVSRLKVFGDR